MRGIVSEDFMRQWAENLRAPLVEYVTGGAEEKSSPDWEARQFVRVAFAALVETWGQTPRV